MSANKELAEAEERTRQAERQEQIRKALQEGRGNDAYRGRDDDETFDDVVVNLETWADINKAPDPSWAIKGLIAHNCITLLTGGPKVGKTTLLATLMREADQENGTFLGQPVEPAPWLLCTEQGQSTLKALMQHTGIDYENSMHILARRALQTYRSADLYLQKLAGIMDTMTPERRPQVIVIDTMMNWLNSHDLNNYNEVVTALRPLQDFRERTESAVIMVHHDNKASHREDASAAIATLGSQAVSAQVDLLARIMHVRDKPNFRQIATIGRLSEQEIITVSWDGQNYRQEEGESNNIAAEIVLGLASQHMKRAEIARYVQEELPSATDKDVKNALDVLRVDRKVVMTGSGRNTVYQLATNETAPKATEDSTEWCQRCLEVEYYHRDGVGACVDDL